MDRISLADSAAIAKSRRARRTRPDAAGKLLKKRPPSDAVEIVSYDEKPGVQAIGATVANLPRESRTHPAFARDRKYKRHGTTTLLAGIDPINAKIHALVKDRLRRGEFIEFLKLLDDASPAQTAIKLILDSYSTQISKKTRCLLAEQRTSPFEFVFTLRHVQGFDLVERCLSKLTRSALRHIRAASKQGAQGA